MADPTDDLTLTQLQILRLHTALIATYPSANALAQLTRLGLGINVATITREDNLPTMALALLEWAGAGGKIRDLLTAAIGGRPTVPDLQALCGECGVPIPDRPAFVISNGNDPLPLDHRIPAPPGDFVGRAKTVTALVNALTAAAGRGAGVGLIHGLGGVGKTALALVVADGLRAAWPRQVRIDLAGAGLAPVTVEGALGLAIRALGYPPGQPLPDGLGALRQLYGGLLGSTPTLVLADDAAEADQVEPLLPPAGHVLLVTTRQRFYLPGATGAADVDLGVLPAPEAESLLRTICSRIGDDAPELARLCGCLPLALIISAGLLRATLRPVADYLHQLADTTTRLQALRGRGSNTSVEAAFALSYAALDPAAQTTLAQLSVFAPGFTAPAATAVVALPPAAAPIADQLDTLYYRSLLDADGTARYRLHDLVRAFAADHLPAADTDAAALRHARHYAAVTDQARNLYKTKDRMGEGLALFDSEQAQIDAGWAWARAHADNDTAAVVLLDYADATAYIGDLRYHQRTERIPQLEAALTAARRLSRKDAEGAFLGNLGLAYADLGEVVRAIGYYEQCLVVLREIGDRRGEGAALGNLGLAYAALGEAQRAIGYHEQRLIIAREIGDRRGEGNALGNLGVAYAALGELERAVPYYEQQLDITRAIGDRQGEAKASWNLGGLLVQQGDLAQAVALMQACVDFEREIGHPDAEPDAARVAAVRARPAAGG